jgi:phosphatidate cytidylyltransferase
MINKELSKRIITSLLLFILLYLVFSYTYILIVTLIIISIISWIEFHGLTSKIFSKNNFKSNILKLLIKALSLIYLTLFSALIFNVITQVEPNLKINMIYLFSICITSDIGGLIFGKIFKGKKLTRISPNQTISGSIGSFILSLILIPFFYYFIEQFNSPSDLLLLTIIVSLSCQLGDLFISYLKRKARVKDTGDLLPGHGGVLDRIDGILFAIPIGMMTWVFLLTSI